MTAAAPSLHVLLEKARELEASKLSDAIPKECFAPRPLRGLLGFCVSYALWGGAIYGLTLAPHFALYLPLWLLAGLGGWGLHCIAHDCGHGAFSSSRRFNYAIGHVALLPLLYGFHAWRHVHNLHHANTNSLERDTDWRPVSREIFSRMGFWDRLIYVGTRSAGFWLGTVHYQLVSMRPSFFPARAARADVRRSNLFVLLIGVPSLGALLYGAGLHGLLVYGLGPWLGIHAWFSTTTLMHHTSEDVPFLDHARWTKNASRLLLTTDYRYPKWLHFLTHNISLHTAHHVAPKVPFYELARAQEALVAAYPDCVRERPFTLGALFGAFGRCHLYDPSTGYYDRFAREHPLRVSRLE